MSTKEIIDERTGATTLTETERHELLASERCRAVLDVLSKRATPISLDRLARDVAERETDADDPTVETVERMTVSLHHINLPKMDDAGVVDYHSDTQQVE